MILGQGRIWELLGFKLDSRELGLERGEEGGEACVEGSVVDCYVGDCWVGGQEESYVGGYLGSGTECYEFGGWRGGAEEEPGG